MGKQFSTRVTYFLQEGKDNLADCLAIAFHTAKQQNIGKIVIFTALGEGIRRAVTDFTSQPDYAGIHLVAVTFPSGKGSTGPDKKRLHVDITPENAELMRDNDIPLVRAHLPFDPIGAPLNRTCTLAQDLALIGETLGIFGGSMSLCVQAVTLACDAGAVDVGEHVIAVTSDTAILAQACCTRKFLSDFIVREILCKPAILTILRKEAIAGDTGRAADAQVLTRTPAELSSGTDESAEQDGKKRNLPPTG